MKHLVTFYTAENLLHSPNLQPHYSCNCNTEKISIMKKGRGIELLLQAVGKDLPVKWGISLVTSLVLAFHL